MTARSKIGLPGCSYDAACFFSGAVGVGSHSARLRRERFPVWRPPLAAPASALRARTTVGGMETPGRSLHLTWAHIVVGWSIIHIWDVRWSIHHIGHVRRFRRGIRLYDGQSRPFGCACGQRGCCPRRTRFNYARGDKCPDHCSDGCNQASDGSQHPRKCSPKSDGWLFFAHGSNPSMRERNADRRTDESEREHSTSSRPVWRVNPPEGQLTRHDRSSGRRRQMVDVGHRCSRVRWGFSGYRYSSIADRAFPGRDHGRLRVRSPAPTGSD
jgi:hypothetical protein